MTINSQNGPRQSDDGVFSANHARADRPQEPDHPMYLDGDVVPGDVSLMVRCMVEEMLQIGVSPEDLISMSRDSNYQALYAGRQELGSKFDELVNDAYRRVGRFKFQTSEQDGTTQSATLTVNSTSNHD